MPVMQRFETHFGGAERVLAVCTKIDPRTFNLKTSFGIDARRAAAATTAAEARKVSDRICCNVSTFKLTWFYSYHFDCMLIG